VGKPLGAAAAESYTARVLAKNPAGYWRFEERAGITARDSGPQGHDGLYKGDVTLGQTGALRSEPDRAVGFDGLTAYVEVPNSAAFSQPTSGKGMTVEVWMRPDALVFMGETDQKYIHWLGKGEYGSFEWGFRFYSQDSPTRPNRISAYMWNPTSTTHAESLGAGAYFQDVLKQGGWIHIVACFDPGDASDPHAGVSIYKNGVLRESPAKSPGARYATYDIQPVHGSAPLRFATRDMKSFFAGGLDEIAIYPRVLSAGEIMENYAAASS
jgi:large repetitive protein